MIVGVYEVWVTADGAYDGGMGRSGARAINVGGSDASGDTGSPRPIVVGSYDGRTSPSGTMAITVG